MSRFGAGFNKARVSQATSPVDIGIAVEDLSPGAGLWNPKLITMPRHGCKIEHRHNEVFRIFGNSHPAQYAVVDVATVDPGVAAPLKITCVQSGCLPIHGVQVRDPLLNTAVLRVLQRMPLYA